MRAIPGALVTCGLLAVVATARAQGAPEPGADRYELSAQSQTYAVLFRRALLPGPAGSLVESETLAPVYEYLSLRTRSLDLPFAADSVGFEVSGWARGLPTESKLEPPVDGDVQTAFVSYDHEGAQARFGRQQVVGGAARFVRFDGLLLGLESDSGLSAQAYGGFTVLPRWNERAYYQHLGSEAESLLRDPSVLEDAKRRREWLAGARVGYAARGFRAGLSFHEQRDDGELGQRNLALEARGELNPIVRLGGSALLDVDSTRFADGRAWLDLEPASALSLSAEYLHTEPALWLSRQSVLSVFSTDRFDEVGALGTLRLLRALRLEAAAFATLYDDHRPGGRGEGTLRLVASNLTQLRVTYARVVAAQNGYHSLRSSLQQALGRGLTGTLEAYGYFYDRAIAGYRVSSVYAGTLAYEPDAAWNLLWGASLSRTPYAALDVQTLLRASFVFDRSERGGRR